MYLSLGTAHTAMFYVVISHCAHKHYARIPRRCACRNNATSTGFKSCLVFVFKFSGRAVHKHQYLSESSTKPSRQRTLDHYTSCFQVMATRASILVFLLVLFLDISRHVRVSCITSKKKSTGPLRMTECMQRNL